MMRISALITSSGRSGRFAQDLRQVKELCAGAVAGRRLSTRCGELHAVIAKRHRRVPRQLDLPRLGKRSSRRWKRLSRDLLHRHGGARTHTVRTYRRLNMHCDRVQHVSHGQGDISSVSAGECRSHWHRHVPEDGHAHTAVVFGVRMLSLCRDGGTHIHFTTPHFGHSTAADLTPKADRLRTDALDAHTEDGGSPFRFLIRRSLLVQMSHPVVLLVQRRRSELLAHLWGREIHAFTAA